MKNEQAVLRYREYFDRFESTLNGESGTPLHGLRREAIGTVERLGFPTLKQEDWRFTNIGPLLDTDFIPATPVAGALPQRSELQPFLAGLTDALTMVFLDGSYVSALSTVDTLPDGLTVRSLADMTELDSALPGGMDADISDGTQAFPALNAAFLLDGAYIRLRRGIACDRVVHLLVLSSATDTPLLIQPRIHIAVEAGASLRVVEQYASLGSGAHFTNAAVSVEVASNAVLEHVVVQQENTQAFHIGMTHARVARDGRYSNRYFGFGGALTRNNITAVFDGENAEAVLEGLYLPTGTQHMDHFTIIDHAQPHCESHELYKGILGDSTRAVFSGRIIVRQDAQKTNAKQSNNNLLLSDDAKVNTKPQLEIYADDVKCTHGATVGRLSDDALFYLRSRGIDAGQARSILAHAFAAELVDRVTIESMHDSLNALINARLNRSTIS
jgi:Fe-S cluster assembly protein SufD